MNVFSILYLTLMVAITIEASKEGDPLIDINESEEEGSIKRSNSGQDRLNKSNLTKISRQVFGDWLVFRQADGNRAYIGQPYIDTNENVGYADNAQINDPPELFMICDKTGNGLKLRDVRNEMVVKIMAQKSHFFNFKYLSADDDRFNGIANVWYDILRQEDQKQEWMVLKNDVDIEPIFSFKSAYRPDYFMATKGKNGAQHRTVILGDGRWEVQKYE